MAGVAENRSNGPERVAPASFTGGAGFEYEDLVCAWATAAMLAGRSPLGLDVGPLREVRGQAAALGWSLDDVVITGTAGGEPRWSASIKSFDMLSEPELSAEFVDAAWRELLKDSFRPAVDRVGFVCSSTGEQNWNALMKLIGDARADPWGLGSRLLTKGAFNEIERSIWASCVCPPSLARQLEPGDIANSPTRLLAALIPTRLDLMRPGSQALVEALDFCRAALAPEQASRDADLWNALCVVVSDVRPRGGALDWPQVASRLGHDFAFALRPDVRTDWELLAEQTRVAMEGVRDVLGDGTTLPRGDAWSTLESTTVSAPVAFVTGQSGCGKTALAKRWLMDHNCSRLWLSSSDLDGGLAAFRSRVGLTRGLADVLLLTPGSTRVVVDGLDRAYAPDLFAAAAAIARAASASDGRLQLLITSQQMELRRVARQLADSNGPSGAVAQMANLDDDDVRIVLERHPQLQKLAVAGQLESVLRRPKLLDLVLRAASGGEPVLQLVTDEASVAEVWWQHFVLSGPSPAARQELVIELATRQADEMLPWTPAGDLPAGNVERADELRRDGVLDQTSSRYIFSHDLFADWALLQRLRALGDGALGQLGRKAELPTWHRAIRLHALLVLREQGLEAWAAQRESLDADDQRLVADLFLDATLFADDALSLLEAIWPTLVADDGALLQRLLRRFLHVATLPDPRGTSIFADDPELEAHWAAQARVPLWPMWLPVLELLDRHRDDAIAAATSQVATAADLWLRVTRHGWPSRDRAAAIALAVGRYVLQMNTEGSFLDDKLEAALWRCALASGAVEPRALVDLVVPALEAPDEADELP